MNTTQQTCHFSNYLKTLTAEEKQYYNHENIKIRRHIQDDPPTKIVWQKYDLIFRILTESYKWKRHFKIYEKAIEKAGREYNQTLPPPLPAPMTALLRTLVRRHPSRFYYAIHEDIKYMEK